MTHGHHHLRASALAALLLLVSACQGYFPPRQPLACRGVLCSGHGSCVADGEVASCDCDDGYVAEDLSCVLGELDPCDLNAGWGAPCDDATCRDGSFCSSMFLEPEMRMCFLTCESDEDCRDVSLGEELCGATSSDRTFCFIVCERDSQCPCGLLCLALDGADYRICSPM